MFFFSNKISIRESRLLEGLCDYHCHLLPGVDDGVQEMEETLQLLQTWESVGVKDVWLTPHIMEDMPNKPERLREKFSLLQQQYTGSVGLHLAAEHMMDGLFPSRFAEKAFLPIGADKSHLLVETSYYIPPINMEGMLRSIKQSGITPLLAHPERYEYMGEKDYKYYKDRQILFQLNLPSLIGAYGPAAQQKAEWLLDHNMYSCCGTDMHSLRHAEYFLNSKISKKTLQKVKELAGKMAL